MHDISYVTKIFPLALKREIEALSRDGSRISEIRIRRKGRTSLVICGRSVPLAFSASDSFDAIFNSVCRGTPYAYRDSIERGYVPLGEGVRVGVAGRARYEGGRLVGVDGISSLVFRLPSGRCDFTDELYAIWRRAVGGLLIFSPPGGGKTTALRALAARLASGATAKRVVIVDEREELSTDELSGLELDILSGYRRGVGISIATRALSPEVIITDEIAPEDSEELLACANSGVPIVASAHAASIDELLCRPDIDRLISRGVFTGFVSIAREGGKFICREEFVKK